MEATPGKMGELVSQHRNGEGELATIERCINPGPYKGALLFCLYDDETPTVAPMLLDVDTVEWLRDVVVPAAGADDI
jgi:hypothetical protein